MTPINLPLPPTSNTMWRRVGNRTLLSKKYRQWKEEAAWALNASNPNPRRWFKPVMVDITCRRPSLNCDIDNRIKPILDLLEATGLVSNDRLVVEVRARWGDVEGAVVTVSPIVEGQA